MRVLFLTGEYAPMQGGVGDYVRELAQAVAARGVEAQVLTRDARIPPSAIIEPPAIHVHRLVPQWNWRSIQMVRSMLEQTRADMLHIQYQTAAFGMHPAINLTPRLIRRHGFGVITTFHDLKIPYLFPKAGRVREWITFELVRSSDAVIATNAEDHARLAHNLRKPISLIPIGSNIAPTPPPDYDRAAWRAQHGVAPNETLLSYFGFLNVSKGGTDLIRALAQVPNAKLLMVGGQIGASDPTNVAYLAQVKALIAELGLTARVLWTDYAAAPIVSAHLLASDICVLPYRDGASFRRGSFMAALAHGLAIVTTSALTDPLVPHASLIPRSRIEGQVQAGQAAQDAARLPELRDGENVLLVPPANPTALADAITRLAANPELRVQLSAGARELAEHFTWDKIAAQHLELYRSLMVK